MCVSWTLVANMGAYMSLRLAIDRLLSCSPSLMLALSHARPRLPPSPPNKTDSLSLLTTDTIPDVLLTLPN